MTKNDHSTNSTSRLKYALRSACTGIERQGSLPDSPCEATSRGTELCAGAWIVRAALADFHTEQEARAFEAELVGTGDTNRILAGARRVGLPIGFVRDAIALNDSTPKAQRVPTVLAHFRSA